MRGSTFVPNSSSVFHQPVRIVARVVEHKIDDARSNLLATPLNLFYDRVRTADEAGRQHPADIGSPSFAGDIARIQLQRRVAHSGPHRKDRSSRLLERLL